MTKLTNVEYITKVNVESFPSRVELYSFLDVFLEKKGIKKDYTADNKDNVITFSFKNPDTAFEFVKSINLEKLKNPLYAKTKTNMFVDVKSQPSPLRNPKKHNTNKSERSHKLNLPISNRLTNSLDVSNLNRSTISHPRSESTNVSMKAIKMNIKNEILDNSLNPHNILLISTPYISEDERQKRELKENKQKWVVNNDFSKYVGKATINRPAFIKNYVNLTPSEPPVCYQFRGIKKEKWIAKKNFFV